MDGKIGTTERQSSCADELIGEGQGDNQLVDFMISRWAVTFTLKEMKPLGKRDREGTGQGLQFLQGP